MQLSRLDIYLLQVLEMLGQRLLLKTLALKVIQIPWWKVKESTLFLGSVILETSLTQLRFFRLKLCNSSIRQLRLLIRQWIDMEDQQIKILVMHFCLLGSSRIKRNSQRKIRKGEKLGKKTNKQLILPFSLSLRLLLKLTNMSISLNTDITRNSKAECLITRFLWALDYIRDGQLKVQLVLNIRLMLPIFHLMSIWHQGLKLLPSNMESRFYFRVTYMISFLKI